VKQVQAIPVETIRRDFPILARKVHGKDLIYLDNAATSQKPYPVIRALSDYYSGYNANVHRGIHALAEAATAAFEQARRKVAAFIGADDPACVIFTRGATEAINLVRYSWGRANVKAGDEILLTVMEHHSNLVPWQQLAQETGAALKFVDIDDEGCLRMDQYEDLLSERTKLVAVTQASNVLGTINPVREMAEMAHRAGAAFLCDGAQSVPHMPVSVKELGCDILAFSGHKMLGPTGTGAVWIRREILEGMPPFHAGGEMIRHVRLESADWNDLPWRFEAGTPNIAGAIGLGAAVDYLRGIGMEAVRAHEVELTSYALQQMGGCGGTIYGPADVSRRGGVISFTCADVHPHDIAQVLDAEGIAIRAGHHCAMPLMKRLGVVATARVSLYLYNTRAEIDAVKAALPRALAMFRR
jgi:cysteine desulfurase/selenocysteine lyase